MYRAFGIVVIAHARGQLERARWKVVDVFAVIRDPDVRLAGLRSDEGTPPVVRYL
jgi:hypothetical protein